MFQDKIKILKIIHINLKRSNTKNKMGVKSGFIQKENSSVLNRSNFVNVRNGINQNREYLQCKFIKFVLENNNKKFNLFRSN